ncbi:MAG: membrane protein insertase YidC [Bacteroidales bacterium]|nr:membrane protein insertase YidC [Bacteroidales bacterium]
MDKNTIYGFIAIAAILFGFTWYQSKQAQEVAEAMAIEQAYQDSIANVQKQAELAEMAKADSLKKEAGIEDAEILKYPLRVYQDTLLEASRLAEAELIVLSNDKMEVTLNTKGAQPYSVKLSDYCNYDSTATYIFHGDKASFGASVYAGEYINTSDFVFEVVEKTAQSAVLRLPFTGGGYIEQVYTLADGSYDLQSKLAFVGMDNVIPRNVTSIDFDYNVTIPRMEKGYQNEMRYSKTNVYYPGEKKPVEIGRGRSASKKIDGKSEWFAFQQQFFSIIVTPEVPFTNGDMGVEFLKEEDPSHDLMVCNAKMRADFKVSEKVEFPVRYYFGPNHYKTLKAYDKKYEKIIPLGGWLVGWFTKYVIIPLFDLLHNWISNFGLIILLMTIFIKIVVLPFSYKSYSSSAKMQAIKPEIDKLNEKYPNQDDAMKKQQAQMDLYRRAGINPMGGCLPMLIQFPILWAMFRFFPASIELRQQSFLWADDLSGYDSILDFGFRIPLLGDHLSLFALLMAVSMFFYSRMTMTQMSGNDPNAQSMRFMSLWMMPIMMFFICNNLSAGLSYYYLLSNIITMIETFIIKKFFVDGDAIRARLKATEGKKAPKSKWQQRLEEAQRMQEQMRKQQKR